MNNRKIKNRTAFTLIELMVVIFLIALIGSLVSVYFSQYRRVLRDGKRLMDVSEIQLALENYRMFEGYYPIELNPGEALVGSSSGRIYLDQVPENPIYRNSFCSSPDYNYTYDAEEDEYRISFCLEGRFENYNPGSKCAFSGEVFEGACVSCPSFISDIDGNNYSTVVIGNQCWMAENLKVTKYNDGSDILYPGVDMDLWVNNTEGAYACWWNDMSNCSTNRGALYNWYAISNPKGLCPEGWHVATHYEFIQLENNVCVSSGNSVEYCQEIFPFDYSTNGWLGTDEGRRLKAVTWSNGTDDLGFSLVPTGYRHDNGNFYSNATDWAFVSTATEIGDNNWRRLFSPDEDRIQRVKNAPKTRGNSVRCVQDY